VIARLADEHDPVPLRDFMEARELHHLGSGDRRDVLVRRDDAAAGEM
jgi:hypothetical protein